MQPIWPIADAGSLGHKAVEVNGLNFAKYAFAIGEAFISMALNSLGVGTGTSPAPPATPPVLMSTRSKAPVKKVLFLMMGPSTSPPNWLRMYFGFSIPARFEKKSSELSERFRLNSYSAPWKVLVPVF